MAAGIYIHIPFCKRKCPYCDFYSIVADDNIISQYVESLKLRIIRIDQFQPIQCTSAEELLRSFHLIRSHS